MNELRNPAWESLASLHESFNRGDKDVRYYPEDVSPFIAVQKWDQAHLQLLQEKMPANRRFFMTNTEKPDLSSLFDIVLELPLYQMACTNFKPSNQHHEYRPLTKEDVPQMLELTALTKPGPFYTNTIAFGNYKGIFNNGQLVAMAGERMKCIGFTEVSAICTHPDHTGHGYASFLSSLVIDDIIKGGCIPFLHVKQDNESAIRVYEKLGFSISNEMYFAIFKKR